MMFSKQCEEYIEKIYLEKVTLLPEIGHEIYGQLAEWEKRSRKEQDAEYVSTCSLAMKYLYAAMPLSDMVNFPFAYFLDFAVHAAELMQDSAFVREYPEEIFLEYVLYHRVNTEEIAPCRSIFYQELKKWMKGRHVREAALEVNYWCAKEASYQSTDDRTMSALEVYRSGAGRCGEESVFLVNALRSAGIPARQVYAPRWSHCDDNHAWVETFVDGRWMFMGACEPEEVFNRGWFNSAASRALIINSKNFSSKPSGETAGRDGGVIFENQTSRYADVRQVNVCVKDGQGTLLSGVTVAFQVINYSEIVTIASAVTDENGQVTLSMGLGCVLVYASHKGYEERLVLDVKKESACTLILHPHRNAEEWTDFDMTAPADAPKYSMQLEKEVKEAGREKFAYVSALRQKKTENLKNPEIDAFLGYNPEEKKEKPEEKRKEDQLLKKKLVDVLSLKDKRDCKAEVLEEHFQEALPYKNMYPEEIFVPYILNPRIGNEPMTKYRKFIRGFFSDEQKKNFCRNPRLIWEYLKETVIQKNELDYSELTTSPAACLKYHMGSEQSCKILFIAIARTFGIPARLHKVDGEMEFFSDNRFVPVEKNKEKTAKIILNSGSTDTVWTCFSNWSIARLENGTYHSLHLEDAEWDEAHPLCILAAAGDYGIITSNRLPNGNIFAKKYFFHLKEQEEKNISLFLREADLEEMLNDITLFPFSLKSGEGNILPAEKLVQEKITLLMFLEEGKEPTEHILNEMMERCNGFRGCGAKIAFVLKNAEASANPTMAKCLRMIPEIQLYYDDFTMVSELGRKLYVDPEKLPLLVVISQSFHGIYAASGYHVGMADMLLRILQKKNKEAE